MPAGFPDALASQFRPVAPIAEGGFGAVWRAVQVALERPVALKLLHAHTLEDADAMARFANEARITAALRHPHVVQVYDSGVADGRPWIAYELVEGSTLADAAGGRPMPWTEARDAVRQVAAALEAAHALGILHRDIKPANVMLAAPGVYKVADFGIAKWTAGSSVKTEHGIILGTPTYISPEQVQGLPASPATDLYAVATMFFELVCGRPPFLDDNIARLLARRIQQDPPGARSFAPEIPVPVEKLLAQALARAPEQRYASAAELGRALDALGDGAGGVARSGAGGEVRGHAGAGARDGAGGGTAAVRVPRATSKTAAVRRTAPRTPALPPPAAGTPRAPVVVLAGIAAALLAGGWWFAVRGKDARSIERGSPSPAPSMIVESPRAPAGAPGRRPVAVGVKPLPGGVHVLADLAGDDDLVVEVQPLAGGAPLRRKLERGGPTARATVLGLRYSERYMMSILRERDGRVLVERLPFLTESSTEEKLRSVLLQEIHTGTIGHSDAVRDAEDVRLADAVVERVRATGVLPGEPGHLWFLARNLRHRGLVDVMAKHEREHPTPDVGGAIVRAMGQVRAPGALERARDILAGRTRIHTPGDALLALLYHDPPLVDEVLAQYPHTGLDQEVLRAVSILAPEKLRAYFAEPGAVVAGDRWYRPGEACVARRMLGDDDALGTAATGPNGRLAIHAALALARMGTPRARAALTQAVARWPQTPSILLSAGLGGDEHVGAALAARLARGEHAGVQRAAALALGALRGVGRAELLAATSSPTPSVAEAAAWALGRRREAGSGEALRALFTSPRDRHGIAGWALARVEGEAALGALVKRFEELSVRAAEADVALTITGQALVELGEASRAVREKLGAGPPLVKAMKPLLVPRKHPGTTCVSVVGVAPREPLGVELPEGACLSLEYAEHWIPGKRVCPPKAYAQSATDELALDAARAMIADRASRLIVRYQVACGSTDRDLDETDPPFVMRFWYRTSPSATREP